MSQHWGLLSQEWWHFLQRYNVCNNEWTRWTCWIVLCFSYKHVKHVFFFFFFYLGSSNTCVPLPAPDVGPAQTNDKRWTPDSVAHVIELLCDTTIPKKIKDFRGSRTVENEREREREREPGLDCFHEIRLKTDTLRANTVTRSNKGTDAPN